jgi:hypothetical protein
MKHHLRIVAVLALAVLAYGALIYAFRLINAPSDRSVVGGILVIFGLLLFVPALVRAVWRIL